MNAAPAQCYCCREEIESVKWIATFEAVKRPVCRDCADGISNGLDILKREGVTGEHLGQFRNQQ